MKNRILAVLALLALAISIERVSAGQPTIGVQPVDGTDGWFIRITVLSPGAEGGPFVTQHFVGHVDVGAFSSEMKAYEAIEHVMEEGVYHGYSLYPVRSIQLVQIFGPHGKCGISHYDTTSGHLIGYMACALE